MPSQSEARDLRLYVQDMLLFCERAISYAAGFERAQLEAEPMRWDALLRNLELIGEAATHLPQSVRELAPAIPWRQIVATRNRLIHGYLGIDADTVWSILTEDLPALRTELVDLLAGWA